MRPICGHSEPGAFGTVCVGTPGHRGKHKMRGNSPAALRNEGVIVKKEEPVNEAESETGINEAGPLPGDHEITPAEALKIVAESKGWTPDEEDFINLKGKFYLPARRRIQWMRGEVVAHPDWTIDTEIVTHEIGKRVGPGRVEGGYALMRASIYDADGRLIATGIKSEYSENFPDYIEKAETGAIARALAVAGFGTESALDLDEGLDKERIADAPVEKPRLGPSAVAGVGRGGKTEGASAIQIRRVAELSRGRGLGVVGLAAVVEELLDIDIPVDVTDDRAMAAFLSTRTSAELGKIIESLEAAAEK